MVSSRYKPNSTPDALDNGEGRIIIDAKSDAIKAGTPPKVYPNASWWEIKATDRSITFSTNNNQIRNGLRNLVDHHPDAAADVATVYNVVTTANGSVSRSLIQTSYRHGVIVVHWEPQYKIVNGKMVVRFGYQLSGTIQGPTQRILIRLPIYMYGGSIYLVY